MENEIETSINIRDLLNKPLDLNTPAGVGQLFNRIKSGRAICAWARKLSKTIDERVKPLIPQCPSKLLEGKDEDQIPMIQARWALKYIQAYELQLAPVVALVATKTDNNVRGQEAMMSKDTTALRTHLAGCSKEFLQAVVDTGFGIELDPEFKAAFKGI